MTHQPLLPQDHLHTELILAELRGQLPGEPPSAPEPEPRSQTGEERLHGHILELQSRWFVPRPAGPWRIPVLSRCLAYARYVWDRAFTRVFLQRQVDFNAAVVRWAQYLEHLLNSIEGENRYLRAQAAEYDRAWVDAARRLAQVELAVGRALARAEDQAGADARDAGRALLLERLQRLEALVRAPAPHLAPAAGAPASPAPAELDIDYFAFEQRFRGPREAVMAGQRPYVEYFQRASSVIDVGCGRGEFLELLREAGIPARGVDGDPDMAAFCTNLGLDVVHGDLFHFLEQQPDAGAGGIFSAQVIEHLPPPDMLRLLRLAHGKLAPGGVLVLETINPVCLVALASSYLIDLTHRRPVHPDTLAFLAESLGFAEVAVRYTSPVPDGARLQPLAPPPDGAWEPWRVVLNENVEKLNHLLYGYQDYALIARKPA